MMRHNWIDKAGKLAVERQCALAGVCRATLYARQKPKAPAPGDETLKRLMTRSTRAARFTAAARW